MLTLSKKCTFPVNFDYPLLSVCISVSLGLRVFVTLSLTVSFAPFSFLPTLSLFGIHLPSLSYALPLRKISSRLPCFVLFFFSYSNSVKSVPSYALQSCSFCCQSGIFPINVLSLSFNTRISFFFPLFHFLLVHQNSPIAFTRLPLIRYIPTNFNNSNVAGPFIVYLNYIPQTKQPFNSQFFHAT